ncbi:MAG: hypothetical protein KatS3mg051_1627 [Anaerolineae bacterium]|nr:MAG: hypothetical protein KatS3mg051_1627 [Anaerolineae bacterium]
MFFLPDLGAHHWALITVPGLLLYIGLGALGQLGHPLLTWPETPIELIVLFITQFLTRTISLVVAKLEQVLENVVIDANSTRILSAIEGEETVNSELFRARRFNRPVALMVLCLDSIPQLRSSVSDRFDFHSGPCSAAICARASGSWSSRWSTAPIRWPGTATTWCCACRRPTATRPRSWPRRISDLVSMTLNLRLPIGDGVLPRRRADLQRPGGSSEPATCARKAKRAPCCPRRSASTARPETTTTAAREVAADLSPYQHQRQRSAGTAAADCASRLLQRPGAGTSSRRGTSW